MASLDSRIRYDRPGNFAWMWWAAPIPDRPAPTISTSTCSVATPAWLSANGIRGFLSAGLLPAGAQPRLHDRQNVVVMRRCDPGERVEEVGVRADENPRLAAF